MMRSLSSSSPETFRQIVALDQRLDLFSRAWCVAELVEGRKLEMDQVLIIRDSNCLPRSKAAALKKVRVQDCQASRPEDVEDILAKIDDKDAFNRELQELLFEGQYSLIGDLQRQLKRAEPGELLASALDALS